MRTEPSDVEGEFRHPTEQIPDFLPRQEAKLDIRQSLDAVLGSVEHARLQPDKITGKQKIQNLPAPVRQVLEPECPACVERIDICTVLPGADDLQGGIVRKPERGIAIHP